MSCFQGTIFSEVLGMDTGLSVILPADFTGDIGEMPTLYLLHGLCNNNSSWIRKTNIYSYAKEAGIAVIMPEVQRSFYANMEYGLNYFDYVAKELPEICKKLFNISHSPEKTFIAGLSMGGYGAMKVALTYPENFAAAASFSGALDMAYRETQNDDSIPLKEMLGINNNKLKSEENLLYLVENLPSDIFGNIPNFYITCGLSDSLYQDNKNFINKLEEQKLSFVYEEWEGAHTWDFWDKSIQKALKVFLS